MLKNQDKFYSFLSMGKQKKKPKSVSCLEQVSQMLKAGELLEVSVVARKLNRSVRTIYDWLDSGKIEGLRIGGRRYIYRKSLEEFLTNPSS